MLISLLTVFALHASPPTETFDLAGFKPPTDFQLKLDALRAWYVSPDLAGTRLTPEKKRAFLNTASQPALRAAAWRLLMNPIRGTRLLPQTRLWAALRWLPEILPKYKVEDGRDYLVRTKIQNFYSELMFAIAEARSDLSDTDGEQVLLSFNRILRTWTEVDQWSVTRVGGFYSLVLGSTSMATVTQKSLALQGLHAFSRRLEPGRADRAWILSLIEPERFAQFELRQLATELATERADQNTGTNCTEEILSKK